MTQKQAWILSGQGIECELETQEFLKLEALGFKTDFLPVPKLLKDPSLLNQIQKGDMVWIPGGFSFSDHFGSGRLLAHEFEKMGFFEKLLPKGVFIIGVCNGFQVLVRSGVFGPNTELAHNISKQGKSGFVNRWVKLKYDNPDKGSSELKLPVRHGEGRLDADVLELAKHQVKPFLFYSDADFSNGSVQDIAGLKVKKDKSWVVGMMPHPEVASKKVQDPEFFAGDSMKAHRKQSALQEGAGLGLIQDLWQSFQAEGNN